MKEKTLFVIMIVNIIITLILGVLIGLRWYQKNSSFQTTMSRLHCSSATCPKEKCNDRWCDCYYCEDEDCEKIQNVKCEAEKVKMGD